MKPNGARYLETNHIIIALAAEGVRRDMEMGRLVPRNRKNTGIPHHQMWEQLAILVGDTSYCIKNGTYSPDEIAIRIHHRLVFIHPFANGNGRHARFMANVLAKLQHRPEFTWGAADIVTEGEIRRGYIDALSAADKNDIDLLHTFARS